MTRGKDHSIFVSAVAPGVLFYLAVAQPLLDLLQKNPQFFVARQSKPVEIVLFALTLGIILPAGISAIVFLISRIHRTLGKVFSSLLIVTFMMLLSLPLLKKIEVMPGWLLLSSSFVLAIGFCFVFLKAGGLQKMFLWLSILLLLGSVIFLKSSSISKILQQKGPAAPMQRVQATAPVVFMILDEFPLVSLLDEDGSIDAVRFPNFAKFQKDSLWFRNATTVADGTPEAIAAILSGKFPTKGQLPILKDFPNNLFTILGPSYELKVLEQVSEMSPKNMNPGNGEKLSLATRMQNMLLDVTALYLHIVSPNELREALPAIHQTWGNFWADDDPNNLSDKFPSKYAARREEFQEFLKHITKADKPTLYFHHILLPHVPWAYLPSGKEYDFRGYGPMGVEGMSVKEELWIQDEWVVHRGYQRHLLQVCYVDRMLGQLIDRLKEQGLYDRALIVITGDHGSSYRPGDMVRSLTSTNYQDILPVPVLMKLPGRSEGTIIDKNFETIDILPTVLDALGIQASFSMDGQSALRDGAPRSKKKVLKTIFRENELRYYDVNLPGVKVSVLRKIRFFGTGDVRRIYDAAMDPTIPAIDLQAARAKDNGSVVLELKNPASFEKVDLQSDFLPVFISGRALFSTAPEKEILIGVWINGTFRGVTRTFPPDKNVQGWLRTLWLKSSTKNLEEIHGFGIVVPETSFRQGKNDIQLVNLGSSIP